MKNVAWTLLAAALVVLGCGSDDATGSVRVNIDGEDGALVGYPNGSGEDVIAFSDGWSLTFDHVFVSIRDFRLQAIDGDDAMLSTDQVVVDLHSGVADAYDFDGVPARRWDRVSYRISPVTADTRTIGVDDADKDRMVAGGYSLLLEGTAVNGDRSVAFSFGIPLAVHSSECIDATDETEGMVVTESGTSEASITIHLDHLFFDSYATEEPDMRFEAIAAEAEDGMVTLPMLMAQSITDVRDADGEPIVDGEEAVVYDPGPLAIDGSTLRDYILAASSTVGHFQGEGHCEYEVE